MALNFHILSLLKEKGNYAARVRFLGTEEDYIIKTNGLLFHNGLDSEYNFMICNINCTIPTNEEAGNLVVQVTGRDSKKARMLEEALIEFMCNQ